MKKHFFSDFGSVVVVCGSLSVGRGVLLGKRSGFVLRDELNVVKELYRGRMLIIRWPHVAKFMFIWAALRKFFPGEENNLTQTNHPTIGEDPNVVMHKVVDAAG